MLYLQKTFCKHLEAIIIGIIILITTFQPRKCDDIIEFPLSGVDGVHVVKIYAGLCMPSPIAYISLGRLYENGTKSRPAKKWVPIYYKLRKTGPSCSIVERTRGACPTFRENKVQGSEIQNDMPSRACCSGLA